MTKKSWVPSLITLAFTAVSLFAPQAQGFITAHPQVSLILGSVYALLQHLLPSPVAKTE